MISERASYERRKARTTGEKSLLMDVNYGVCDLGNIAQISCQPTTILKPSHNKQRMASLLIMRCQNSFVHHLEPF